MWFPIFKKKINQKSLINPNFNNFDKIKKIEKLIPKKCILTYQNETFNYILDKFKTDSKSLNDLYFVWWCKWFYTKDFVFVLMNWVGAPHCIIVFEQLISIWIKEFINLWAVWGFEKIWFYICDKALRDEGTSYHYLKHSKFAYPDILLMKKLENSFKKLNIDYSKAWNWTTDAIFRETKIEIDFFKSLWICTVDMESSALFVVAKLKNVKVASIFFTSDILWENWLNLYKKDYLFLKNSLEQLARIWIYCFLN